MPQRYNSNFLLDVVNSILPSGAEAWKLVCIEYQKKSGEATLRDYEDVRRHFHENLCNKVTLLSYFINSNTTLYL